MGTTGKPKQETEGNVVGEHQESMEQEAIDESLKAPVKQATWPVQSHISIDLLGVFDVICSFLGLSRAEGLRMALILFCKVEAKTVNQLKKLKRDIEEG